MPRSAPAVEDVRAVVALAALAPSVHNSQPWRFRWDGTSLEVREDTSRALPVIDPDGRERVLSCGAAVLQAELALAELGWAVTTTLLPDDGDAELLARLTVTGRRQASAHEHALAAAIPRRTTDRDPYDSRPVPPAVLDGLRRAAEQEGAWLRAVDRGDAEVDLDVLLSRADAAQRADPAYLAELAAWRTEDGRTGVPTAGLSPVPAGRRGSSLALRDFDAGAAERPADPGPDGPPPVEHPAVVVLGTSGDSRADWLAAGRATARVLLAATGEGVAAQPLTAVVEVPSTRERLRTALGGLGRPQMVLRLGYGTRGPVSARLPVEQVLEVAVG
jgi:nitroreductase